MIGAIPVKPWNFARNKPFAEVNPGQHPPERKKNFYATEVPSHETCGYQ